MLELVEEALDEASRHCQSNWLGPTLLSPCSLGLGTNYWFAWNRPSKAQPGTAKTHTARLTDQFSLTMPDADGLLHIFPVTAGDAHPIGKKQPVFLGTQIDRRPPFRGRGSSASRPTTRDSNNPPDAAHSRRWTDRIPPYRAPDPPTVPIQSHPSYSPGFPEIVWKVGRAFDPHCHESRGGFVFPGFIPTGPAAGMQPGMAAGVCPER